MGVLEGAPICCRLIGLIGGDPIYDTAGLVGTSGVESDNERAWPEARTVSIRCDQLRGR